MRRTSTIAALLLVAACASSTPSTQPTTTAAGSTTTSTVPLSTTAATTTVTAATTTTSATTTTATTTTTAVATTTTSATEPATTATTAEPCPAGGTFDDTRVAFPDRMSPLVGRDIRTGAHACFERVVIEFQAASDGRTGPFPGYAVRYVPLPVNDSPRGEPVELDGTHALLVSITAWMPSMEGDGYAGPGIIRPTNVTHIRELRRVENFEGMTAWAIGLDGRYPYVVTVLDGPPRLVVDLLVS